MFMSGEVLSLDGLILDGGFSLSVSLRLRESQTPLNRLSNIQRQDARRCGQPFDSSNAKMSAINQSKL